MDNISKTFGLGQDLDKPTAKEGELTQKVENVTAQIPSIGYLGLALGSMVLSAGIALFSTKKTLANFVGLWVPTIMCGR